MRVAADADRDGGGVMLESIKMLHVEVSNHCDEISKLFEDEVCVTVLVRNKVHPQRDVIVSDDDVDTLLDRLDGFLDLN